MSQVEIDELCWVFDIYECDEVFQVGCGYYQQEGDYDFYYWIIQGSGNVIFICMFCGEFY